MSPNRGRKDSYELIEPATKLGEYGSAETPSKSLSDDDAILKLHKTFLINIAFLVLVSKKPVWLQWKNRSSWI